MEKKPLILQGNEQAARPSGLQRGHCTVRLRDLYGVTVVCVRHRLQSSRTLIGASWWRGRLPPPKRNFKTDFAHTVL